MKYLKSLTKRKLSSWKNKRWYHQRFDGSPYFMHMIAEAELRKEDRKKGCHFTVHYCFYENGKADWYILIDDIERITKKIIELGKVNPNISKKLIDSWENDDRQFYAKCEEIGKINLSDLKDYELVKLHDEFLELILSRQTSSSIIDGFALGTDELVASKIKIVYDNSDINDKFKSSEVFSTLTAPVKISFINQAEIELLKTALEIKNHPEKKANLLENYQKKYFWIRNNYVDAFVLSVEDFEKEIEELYTLGMDIDKAINRLSNTAQNNIKKKQELMQKLNLDEELKFLIKVSEDFTYWQDIRKKSTLWTTHYFMLFLEEFSKRAKVPLDEIKYMSPREVAQIFDIKPNVSELEERRKNGVYYWDKEGHEALSGNEADEIKQEILGTIDLSDVNDFRGLTASTGKATGTVKVLKSAKEIAKVEKGDILVAVMTRPDYVPAMKKAAAIVTDEGGITSHAAIVSRELGIPCVIGTKIATKVLKDGMKVEVNANHSWVRIL